MTHHVDMSSFNYDYHDSLVKKYGKFVKSFKFGFLGLSGYRMSRYPEKSNRSATLCPYLKKWAGMLKNIQILVMKNVTVPEFLLFRDIISRATYLEVKTTKYCDWDDMYELHGRPGNQLYTLLEKNNFEIFFEWLLWAKGT
ncbi:hypothetical protein DSO57_1018735 [Entomophthora muscae]|uniref:Uncharacterized protein n=1 Tax=Entomophthora muscae TaxID=34485 RepID=A0ACC2S685_9FUNG|nr:hypothetical protein DSO57_1018735 [Entomophthora muscae]